jgi:hypothetical protein
MTHNNSRARNAEVEEEIRPSSDDRDQEQDTVEDTRFLINPEHSRIEPSKRCRVINHPLTSSELFIALILEKHSLWRADTFGNQGKN